MCSEYQVNLTEAALTQALKTLAVKNSSPQKEWKQKIRFTNRAPAIEMIDGEAVITERVFPASPFPNARLSGQEDESDDITFRRVYELPRWKDGFKNHPLLIPATSFNEPVYWGKNAGTVQEFSIPNEKMFFLAGIAIKPFVPKTGKTDGFALLTHTATKQMLESHHRLVVLLKPEHAADYLADADLEDPRKRFDYLIANRYTGPLDQKQERKMAKGWDRRAENQQIKLERELEYVKALKAESVEG